MSISYLAIFCGSREVQWFGHFSPVQENSKCSWTLELTIESMWMLLACCTDFLLSWPFSLCATGADGLVSILSPAPHLRVGFSEDQSVPGGCCLYLPDHRCHVLWVLTADMESSSVFSDFPSRSWVWDPTVITPSLGWGPGPGLCRVQLVPWSPSVHTGTSWCLCCDPQVKGKPFLLHPREEYLLSWRHHWVFWITGLLGVVGHKDPWETTLSQVMATTRHFHLSALPHTAVIRGGEFGVLFLPGSP